MQQENCFRAISSVTNGKLLTPSARIVLLHSSKRLIRARAYGLHVVQDDLWYVPRLVLSVTQISLVFDPCYNALCLLSCLQ
jgi:hypothetical protein